MPTGRALRAGSLGGGREGRENGGGAEDSSSLSNLGGEKGGGEWRTLALPKYLRRVTHIQRMLLLKQIKMHFTAVS